MTAALGALLADPAAAGGFRVISRAPTAILRRRIDRTGRRCFVLDGNTISDKATFLRACAQAMAFPAYFGHNWDALDECLTDLAWAPAHGYAILYENVAPFIRQAPAEWSVARDILIDAVDYWRGTRTPLVVLLRHTAGLAPEFPLVRDSMTRFG